MSKKGGTKMKKLFVFVFVIILLIGCGKDGEDGNAFLSFTWDWYVDSYIDNNPDVSYTITEYIDYHINPGRYSYEYYCSDGAGNYWEYEGTYTIEINKGKDGGFITDGDDGEDNYYRMSLSGTGTSFNLRKQAEKKSTLLQKSEIDLSLYQKIQVGDIEQEIFYSENGRMIVTKQMFRLIKK